jgi:hypothetical protein
MDREESPLREGKGFQGQRPGNREHFAPASGQIGSVVTQQLRVSADLKTE